MTAGLLPLGVTFASLQGAVAAGDAVEVARWAADLGYRSFWTAEVTGPEAFALLGSVAAQVPALDLGTGVVALQLRTPPLLAMATATLQALVPDRDVLVGVGISSPVVAGRWHGEEGARTGEEHFTRVVRRHEVPAEVPEATFAAGDGPVYLPAVLQAELGRSASHWRRQIDQGGVKLNGEPLASYEVDAPVLDGAVVQAGKRQFIRFRSV